MNATQRLKAITCSFASAFAAYLLWFGVLTTVFGVGTGWEMVKGQAVLGIAAAVVIFYPVFLAAFRSKEPIQPPQPTTGSSAAHRG